MVPRLREPAKVRNGTPPSPPYTKRGRTTAGRSRRSLALFATLAFASAVPAADQPQWGQRHSRNQVSEETGLPEDFDPATGRSIKWKARLGTQSYSTPVIARGKVLIGANNGAPRDPRHKGDRGVLMCFDEQDGAFRWQLVVPKRSEDIYLDWPNTGICSPATVEGERVYLVNNRGEVMCLDLNGLTNGNDGPYRDEARHAAPEGSPPIEPGLADADILWIFDPAAEFGVHQHDAAHGSVLIHGPHLYVNTSNGVDNTHRKIRAPEAPSLFVLDKATAKLLARDEERMGPRIIHSTWASPSLGEVHGRTLVFFGGGDGVCYAFAALSETPAAGPLARLKRLWRFDCDPAAPKENVHDFQDNRREGPVNITGMPVFQKDRVYVTPGGDVWHGRRVAWLKCLNATKEGDITQGGEVWSYPLKSHCLSTPAVHEGLVYIADDAGWVHCVEAETGKPVWTQETRSEIWGSTLVADGKVYVGTQRGQLWVLAAGREKKVLATVELDSAISATPVAANGVLYVATHRTLYAVRKAE